MHLPAMTSKIAIFESRNQELVACMKGLNPLLEESTVQDANSTTDHCKRFLDGACKHSDPT